MRIQVWVRSAKEDYRLAIGLSNYAFQFTHSARDAGDALIAPDKIQVCRCGARHTGNGQDGRYDGGECEKGLH